MFISDIKLKPRFLLSITLHSYLYYVLKLPLIDWMVQRTSLIKPWSAEVHVHKSGSLYACLINRETIKLKPSYINRWEISCKSLIVWGLFWLLFKIGSFSFVIKLACSRRRSDSENTIWTTPATLIMTKVGKRFFHFKYRINE